MKMDGDNVIKINEDGQTIDELMSSHVGLTYKYSYSFSAFFFLQTNLLPF